MPKKAPSFEARRDLYKRLWETMQVTHISNVDLAARKLIVNKQRYINVAAKVGCPWFFIACAHWREASGSFDGVLHNGQKIIGKGTKTTIAPIGRGPFRSWEEAAVDALTIPPHDMRSVKIDSIERFAYESEKFNGFGYALYHANVPSPYLWSHSQHYERGKYSSDGNFDPTLRDPQVGVMPLLKRMMFFDASIDFAPSADVEPVTPKPPANTGPATIGVGAAGTVAVVAATAGVPWYIILAGLVAAGVAAFGIWWWLNHRG